MYKLDNKYSILYNEIISMINTTYHKRPDCRQILNKYNDWSIDDKYVFNYYDKSSSIQYSNDDQNEEQIVDLNETLIAMKSRETDIRVKGFEKMIVENKLIHLNRDHFYEDFWEFFYTYFCCKTNYLFLNL